MNKLEYRDFDLVDVEVDSENRTIVGRTVPYNSESNELRTINGDKFREVILRGALSDSLVDNDIMAFAHHNSELILGRVSAGTLKLEDREDGLYCEIEVPETSYGNDLLVSAKRGDIKGFSFGFNQPVAKNTLRGGMRLREISKMNLREVSVVSSPAYNSTTLSVRSEDFEEEEEVREEAVVEEAPEVKEEVVVKEETTTPEPEVKEPEVVVPDDSEHQLKHRFYTLTHNK